MFKGILSVLLISLALSQAKECNKLGEVYPVKYSCEEYELCVDNILVRKRCETGKYFNGKHCEDKGKTVCKLELCEEGKSYARSDCAPSYDVCFQGKLQMKTCSIGYRFLDGNCVPQEFCKFIQNIQITNKQDDQLINYLDRIKTDFDAECINGQTTNHPTDCTRFELCVDGHWKDQSCQWMAHYDVVTNKCAYWDYKCTYGGPCTEGETKNVYGRCSEYLKCVKNEWKKLYCTDGTYYQEGSCKTSPCPLRPVLNDCSHFMEPNSDEKQECPADQLFDKVERQCVDKSNARCLIGECDEGDKTFLENDCTKYKQCVNGNWSTMTCSYYKHFDSITKQCNYFSYTCGNTETPTAAPPDPTTPQPEPECNQENEKQGIEGDCHGYNICKNNKWVKEACSVWGKFDNDTKECFYFRMWKVHCA